MNIGIIGFGQMAQFMIKFLKLHFNILVSDIEDKTKIAEKLEVKFVSLDEASSQKIVILAVPIKKIKPVMENIKNNLKKDTILFDICSVKLSPARIMLELSPKETEIIGTHPLFGPQSGANGIKGLKIVVCPIRTTKLEKVKEFLQSLGLEVIVCSPEEHDKSMAETQALEHFIGRALINLNIKEGKITTPSFKHLIELKEIFEKDNLELFKSLQEENPFAKKIREKFISELNKINLSLK